MNAGTLTIKGARAIEPAHGTDSIRDVTFSGAKTGDDHIIDADGSILVPGLIDLHTHVYCGGTSLGIDPDAYMLSAGVTTAVDTGSAGPGNFAGFRDHVISHSKARILAFLHVSFAGIFGFDRRVQVGESEDMRLMAPSDALRVARDNPDTIIGIKVRVGRHASGDQGLAPLKIARQVADELALPLMAHIDEPPPTYAEVLACLGAGDILTHAFRPFPNSPLRDNAPMPEVIEARARGVLFDIGHGAGSFSFKTARAMLAGGFAPDVISSDVHALCIDGPAFDLPTTMTKFLALGLPIPQIIDAVTLAPAKAIGRPELGTIDSGDATLLTMEDGTFDLHDVTGEKLTTSSRFAVTTVIRDGKIIA